MNYNDPLNTKEFLEEWQPPPFDKRKPGLKPRRWRVGKRCPVFGERIKVIPEREWADKIQDGYTGMKPSVHWIFDQDGRGSCASESANQGHMIVRSFSGRDQVVFNPWFTYHFVSGGRDGGSSIDENLDSLRSRGSCPMDVWDRSHGFRQRPSEEALEAALPYKILEFYDITTREEFATALLCGFPVCYGRAGHAITAVLLFQDSRGRWKIKYANSWSNTWTDCGDPGYGVDDLDDVRWGYGVWAPRVSTSIGPTPNIVRAIELPLAFEPYPTITT